MTHAPGTGWTTARITHIAARSEWDAAEIHGSYIPPSLATEGFIHCSTSWQVGRTADAHFAGRDDLVLLVIDPREITSTIVFENCDGGIEPFPHVYGELPVAAVERIHELEWDQDTASFQLDPESMED